MIASYSLRLACVALAAALFAQAPGKPTGEAAFAVRLGAPAAGDALLPDSPFGINLALPRDDPNRGGRLSVMRDAGIKWGRTDFSWRTVEAEAGKYDWSRPDRVVELTRRHGILIFANLTSAPAWVNLDGPEAVDAYVRYARAAVRRYKDRVRHWQIWNEPNGGFWKSTPEQYARFLAAAGKAIHEEDPGAKVLGFNMAFCDLVWAERILKQVPYDCFDIACFHPYRPPNDPEEKYDFWLRDHLRKEDALVNEDFLGNAEALRKLMGRFGAPKPVWITEICWNTNIHPYGSNEIRQADMLLRFYTLAVAGGQVEKVFWWTLADGGTRQFDQADMVGICRQDLSPKYAYYAFATMTRRLEGKKSLGLVVRERDTWVAGFTDGKEDTLVAWTTKPFAYIRVGYEEQLTFYDLFGTKRVVPLEMRTRNLPVPLSGSPVFIVGKAGLKPRSVPDPGW